MIAIGKNIRKSREAKGLSQEQLSALAGIDRTYIGSIERGERNVAVINLIRIASALNIEVAALFPPMATLLEVLKNETTFDNKLEREE